MLLCHAGFEAPNLRYDLFSYLFHFVYSVFIVSAYSSNSPFSNIDSGPAVIFLMTWCALWNNLLEEYSHRGKKKVIIGLYVTKS